VPCAELVCRPLSSLSYMRAWIAKSTHGYNPTYQPDDTLAVPECVQGFFTLCSEAFYLTEELRRLEMVRPTC